VPEPATWLLAAVATAFLGIRRKRLCKMPYALAAAFALAFLTTASPVQAEILEGHILTTRLFAIFPHGVTDEYKVESVVGPGTEITGLIVGLDFDFSDTNVLVTSTTDFVISAEPLISLSFEDAHGTIPRFTGVTVNPATTWPGVTPSTPYNNFEPNKIFINLRPGLQLRKGDQLSLDITAIIPEPATAGLLLVGVAFMVVRRGRIRNRKELS
jgi:hypothetical protein